MSKGGGGAPKPVKDDPSSKGQMASGFQPYPANGQFPILPQANFWENGNFMMPGVAAPLMSSDLLQRFPQLAGLFSGRDPNQGQNTSAQPGMYGLPPSFGALNPPATVIPGKKQRGRKDKKNDEVTAFV